MKKIYVLPLFALTAFIGNAEILSPDEALSRAISQSGSVSTRLKAKGDTPKLVYTTTAEQGPSSYVFNYEKTGGFVLVAADDIAFPVLGYSDEGTFDENNIPENFQYWLDSYANEINYAREHGLKAVAKINRPEREAIAPLVTTKWSQDAPFYNMCPLVNGSRCYTGCTATAMAQVMKYHNWPEVGRGSKSYVYKTLRLSVDFSEATYDWDNMLDVYTKDATAEQNNAVALLMYHCGVGASMQYSPSSSGAYVNEAGTALYTYFGYDVSIRELFRDYYGLIEWEDLIYNELANVGPVIYSGYNSSLGHTFVCDGYSNDGYFHINWGWAGLSDGYFLLNALNPDSQGIGGSNGGYSSGQEILANITKEKEGSKQFEIMTSDNFIITPSSESIEDYITVKCSAMNRSLVTINGKIALKLTNKATNEVEYVVAGIFSNLARNSGIDTFTTYLTPDMADGEYSATLVWQSSLSDDTSVWETIRPKIGAVSEYTLYINDGKITAEPVTPYSVSVSDLEVKTSIYSDCNFEVVGRITNIGEGEFKSNVGFALYQNGSRVCSSNSNFSMNVVPGDYADFDELASFSKAAPAEGEYQMYLCSGSTLLSDPIDVTVKPAAGTTAFEVVDVAFGGENKYEVDKHKVPYTFTVKCSSGLFIGSFEIQFWEKATTTLIDTEVTPTIILEAGESKVISGTHDLVDGEGGKSYLGCILYGYEYTPNKSYTFTLAEESGVSNILTDRKAVSETYYNLQGMKVSSPVTGHYILVSTNADGSKSSRHIIIK